MEVIGLLTVTGTLLPVCLRSFDVLSSQHSSFLPKVPLSFSRVAGLHSCMLLCSARDALSAWHLQCHIQCVCNANDKFPDRNRRPYSSLTSSLWPHDTWSLRNNVFHAVSDLDPQKNYGPDGVLPVVLRNCTSVVAPAWSTFIVSFY